MPQLAHQPRFTPEEYLALDRRAAFKSEYVDGEIVAMAGASREHNLIALNIAASLHLQLKGRPCETYMADMRLGVDVAHTYAYPDIAVVCGEPEFLDDSHFDVLLNPTVVIEVLSPSTEDYDRGRKFARYRRLGTLTDYVLVAQDRPQVEHYTRAGMRWSLLEYDTPDAVVDMPSIDCRLALADVYARIAFRGPAGIPRAEDPPDDPSARDR